MSKQKLVKNGGWPKVQMEIDSELVCRAVGGQSTFSLGSAAILVEEFKLVASSLQICNVHLVSKSCNKEVTDLALFACSEGESHYWWDFFPIF